MFVVKSVRSYVARMHHTLDLHRLVVDEFHCLFRPVYVVAGFKMGVGNLDEVEMTLLLLSCAAANTGDEDNTNQYTHEFAEMIHLESGHIVLSLVIADAPRPSRGGSPFAAAACPTLASWLLRTWYTSEDSVTMANCEDGLSSFRRNLREPSS